MGHNAALIHESFVKKLSFQSDSCGTLEGVYTITCSWSRMGDLPETPLNHYVPIFVDMRINLEETDMGYDGNTEYESR
jgi:hypothetical protein